MPLQLVPDKLRTACAEFQQMPNMGIICLSRNPWESPLHMVLKKSTNDWRPCGDFRAIKRVLILDRHPIPQIADLMFNLVGETVFSRMDLVCAYN
ncbi:unnamed protein product [Echinostoma caproni]|uniref:Reverse transcriptase domain-containing protein n=1 Tax=Echinostoma caproni TaxID=27848 RepID=A0A183B8Q7_9TREM|nr:unnamed protein product [Echinostoma caproni]